MTDDFINNYVDIIVEYIERMNESDFIKEQSDRAFLIYSGFKAITHIFQIHFINTNDLEGSFYNSQKAYILYLEYLEQMRHTNMSHDLNHADAIQFLYNKTISEFTVKNITEIKDESFIQIVKNVETIFWFDNTNIIQSDITKSFVVNLLNLDIICNYINIAHKRKMNNDEYLVFLSEIYSLFNKSKKKEDWDCNVIYIIKDWDEHKGLPIKPWCKWLKHPIV